MIYGSLVFLVVETVIEPLTYHSQSQNLEQSKRESQKQAQSTKQTHYKSIYVAATHQVELAGDAVFFESRFDSGPSFLKILLSVSRKQCGEGADFEHTRRIPFRIELLDCPTVAVWVIVPWLILVVFTFLPHPFFRNLLLVLKLLHLLH